MCLWFYDSRYYVIKFKGGLVSVRRFRREVFCIVGIGCVEKVEFYCVF